MHMELCQVKSSSCNKQRQAMKVTGQKFDRIRTLCVLRPHTISRSQCATDMLQDLCVTRRMFTPL